MVSGFYVIGCRLGVLDSGPSRPHLRTERFDPLPSLACVGRDAGPCPVPAVHNGVDRLSRVGLTPSLPDSRTAALRHLIPYVSPKACYDNNTSYFALVRFNSIQRLGYDIPLE